SSFRLYGYRHHRDVHSFPTRRSSDLVVSFNVSNPDEFALIDQLRIGAEEGAYYGKRSIAVTEKRIYISGQDWGGEDHGVADVVDISDPAGDLKLGARFRLAGPVQSR